MVGNNNIVITASSKEFNLYNKNMFSEPKISKDCILSTASLIGYKKGLLNSARGCPLSRA